MMQNMLFDDMTDQSEAERLKLRRKEKPSVEPGPPPAEQRETEKAAILDELRRGPTTNHTLAEVSIGYRQRISDLRKAGYTIVNRRLAGRVSLYELK